MQGFNVGQVTFWVQSDDNHIVDVVGASQRIEDPLAYRLAGDLAHGFRLILSVEVERIFFAGDATCEDYCIHDHHPSHKSCLPTI